jgi:hypothetical protein
VVESMCENNCCWHKLVPFTSTHLDKLLTHCFSSVVRANQEWETTC